MNDLKRLKWRCRRGIREMDIMFVRFLDTHYPTLNDQQKLAFERLIDVSDLDILDWLLKRQQPTDPELAELIEIMLDDDHIPSFS